MSGPPQAVINLSRLTEDERIMVVGAQCMRQGLRVSMITDSTPGKAQRYADKLKLNFPGIVITTMAGPTAGVVTLFLSAPATHAPSGHVGSN
jgi:hypothetical protein